MKTDELIEMLARGAGPAPRAVAARRLVPAAAAGLAASALLALGLFGSIPMAMYASAAPWIKLGYAVSLALAAAWLTARLARPLAQSLVQQRAVKCVICVMGLFGLAAVMVAAPADRTAMLLGSSWASCPWNVLGLSLPALAATMWALRGLAPTRPRAAGFAAGLFAGALGALGYALACPEVSTTFVALWYSLGIALSGALGALLGPSALRW